MQKYALLKDQILHEGIVTESASSSRTLPKTILAHDPEYYRTLQGEWTRQEERRSGFPWSAAMVERERVIMQGTLDPPQEPLNQAPWP